MTSTQIMTPSTAYAPRQPIHSISARETGGITAFDAAKPSPMIESRKMEKTYDCPGPELNATSVPTATTAQP